MVSYRDTVYEIIYNNIDACIKTNSAKCYMQNNIPYRVLNGAINNYAYGVDRDEVIAVIDTTVFGGGERGILLTDDTIYYKGMLEEPRNSHYLFYEEFDIPDDTYFSAFGISSMLYMLANAWKKEYGEIELEETNQPTEKGILNTLLSAGVDLVKDAAENYLSEQIELFISICENLKKEVKDWIKEIDDDIQMECDISVKEEFIDKIWNIYFDAMWLGDIEEIKSLLENATTGEIDKKRLEAAEFDQSIIKDLDEVLGNELFCNFIPDIKKINLEKRVKVFARKMSNIFEEIDDFETDDNEDFLIRSENAAKEFLNALKDSLKQLNKLIEYFDTITLGD